MNRDALRLVAHEGPAGVRIWRADLDAYIATVPLAGLGAAEHARASRMKVRRDALRFLASRHALQRVLSSESAPHFSLSRSGALCVIGLADRQSLGVDVETIRPLAQGEALACSYLTAGERRDWLARGASRDRAFLAAWTRKEACLKALGVGLSVSPARLDTGCGGEARTVAVPVERCTCAATVYPLEIGVEAAAAFALASPADATQACAALRAA